jgi:methylenetetrahydrofolate dehydrogenase (NADP+) / methenyltetrahydrofolate cyclohydrolase
MTARILDGKSLSEAVLKEIKRAVAARRATGEAVPGLAVILVGDDPASVIYVRSKRRACDAVGVRSFSYDLPATTGQGELAGLIDRLNQDTAVHGILVQSPLPRHMDEEAIVERIDPGKDVDGFHPYNIGRLAVRMPLLRSCTPYGVMRLLQSACEPLRGQHAVVVGASNHVGRPMALELLLSGCTVTVCHSATRDLPGHVAQADILVAAVGRPELIKGSWTKEGAIVIDIGINRLSDGRLVGDVEFAAARDRASWITPVPGGVGPMTVATLLQNTLEAASRSQA